MNKLYINLKAAKELGYTTPTIIDGMVFDAEDIDNAMAEEFFKKEYYSFNLFTNAKDTLAVVKMLGGKCGVDFLFDKGLKKWTASFDDGRVLTVGEYEETVGAAVEAL